MKKILFALLLAGCAETLPPKAPPPPPPLNPCFDSGGAWIPDANGYVRTICP